MTDPTARVIAMDIPTDFAALLAVIAKREINKAYGSPSPQWRPMLIRDTTYFGRKRRARRARGRANETRPPYSATAIAFAAKRELAKFIDPSIGEPWPESFNF